MWHLQNSPHNVTTTIHIICNIHVRVILWNLVIWFTWFLVTRGGVYEGLCNNKIFTILREAYNWGWGEVAYINKKVYLTIDNKLDGNKYFSYLLKI